MTFVVLAVLAVVWIVVLGSYSRERLAHRRHDSVSAFRTQLHTLERTQPGSRPVSGRTAPAGVATARPTHRRSEAARIRRQQVLLALLAATCVTLLVAVLSGSPMAIGLCVFCSLALIAYVALLVNQQRVLAERRAKVRHLHPVRPAAFTPTTTPRPTLAASVGRRR